MATNTTDKVIGQLRRILLVSEVGQTDAHLLGRFIDSRDEAAFELLMRRHGLMVLGVCRRLLSKSQDADDAFQATFLVLVRKAASIRSRELLGNWLYGVARQTALRARSLNAQRERRERQVAVMPEPQTPAAHAHFDWQDTLDFELSRLPEKYRIAIVLCDLEGKSAKDAARQLGWPAGSLTGRLSKGRALLASRLARSRVPLSAALVAAELSRSAAPAQLPNVLVSSTMAAISAVAGGQALKCGIVSATVVALTEGVVRTMLLTKLKIVTAIVTIALTCGGICLLSEWPSLAGQTPPDLPNATKGTDPQAPAVAREKQVGQNKNVPTLRDIERALDRLDRMVASYSVDVDFKYRTGDREPKEITYNMTYKSDKLGRVVCSGTTNWAPRGVRKVFNGAFTKSLVNADSGHITNFVGEAYKGAVNPRAFLNHGHIDYLPIRKILNGKTPQILGRETIAGRDVVVVQGWCLLVDGREESEHFYFDVNRNLALVKSAVRQRIPPSKEWKDISFVQVLDSTKDASGVWLPTRAVHEDVRRDEITLKNWVVNPDLPEDLFSLTFPPGTHVRDEMNGRNYQVPEQAPAIEDIRNTVFDDKATLPLQYAKARYGARIIQQHLLVIFAPRQSVATDRLLVTLKDPIKGAALMKEYEHSTLWMDTEGDRFANAKALAKELRFELGPNAGPVLVVTDEDGHMTFAKEPSGREKDEGLDPASVRQFLHEKIAKHLDAEQLLAEALALAKKGNKRVIVQETASWNSACWRLSMFFNAHREIWEKDYLWIKLDHRYTNAAAVAKRLRKDAKVVKGDLPWTAILDSGGNVLATSNDTKGNNIGFPADEAPNIPHFANMLRTTAQRLTAGDIARLTEALKDSAPTEH